MQHSIWRITIEQNRTWDGVSLPVDQRHRSTVEVPLSPFVPPSEVEDLAMQRFVRPKMDRLMKIERWKEVVA